MTPYPKNFKHITLAGTGDCFGVRPGSTCAGDGWWPVKALTLVVMGGPGYWVRIDCHDQGHEVQFVNLAHVQQFGAA